MTGRAALLALAAGLLLAAPTGAAEAGCSAPQAEPPPGTTYVVLEGRRVPSVLGVACLPQGDALSAGPIDWGDGSSSPATVTYQPAYGGFEQVWLDAAHSYARATCRTGGPACAAGFHVAATATDERTGQAYALATLVQVTPAPDAIAPRRAIRVVRGRRFAGQLATVTPGGERRPGELTVRIRWDDGSSSAGTLTARGAAWVASGAHRWRRPGRYTALVIVADHFAGRTDRAPVAVRVS